MNRRETRSQLVTFRLPKREFDLLRKACSSDGGRTVSEAMRALALFMIYAKPEPQERIRLAVDRFDRTFSSIALTLKAFERASLGTESASGADSERSHFLDSNFTSLAEIAYCIDDAAALSRLRELLGTVLDWGSKASVPRKPIIERLTMYQVRLNNPYAVSRALSLAARPESAVTKSDLGKARYWLDRALREIAETLDPLLRSRVLGG